MAKRDEIQFALTLQNEASATMKQFQKDVDTAMKSAGISTDDYGKKVNSLTQWIKEERAEQRQHNFIFAQTKEVVAGASSVLALYGNTLGQTSEFQKTLTNSMNAGFVAFQGVNNVIGLLSGSLSFLSGPWGIAISLAAAGAVAFAQFSGETDKATTSLNNLAAEANELDFQLGRVSESARKAFLVAEIVKAQEKVDALKKTTTDWVQTAATQGRYGVITKIVGTPDEIAAAENGVRKAEQTFKTFYDQQQKANSGGQKSVIAKLKEDLDNLAPGTTAYENKLYALRSAQMGFNEEVEKSAAAVTERLHPALVKTTTVVTTMPGKVKTAAGAFEMYSVQVKESSSGIAESLRKDAEDTLRYASEMAFGTQQVVGTLMETMRTSFAAAFSNGEAVGKQFFKSMANAAINFAEMYLATALATAFAKGVPSFGGTLAGDFALVSAGTAALELARAAVNRFHEGGTMGASGERIPLAPDERPAILRVGETVRTAEQESRLQGGGGQGNITIVMNNPHFADESSFKRLVQMGMRKAGTQDVSEYFKVQRNAISFA